MAALDSVLADPRAETTVGNYFVSNYPPYSTWKADAGSQLVGVLARPAPDESLSLYVHLPFCRRRCNYCYFRVHAGSRRGVVDLYLDSVLEELSLYLRYPAVGGRRLVSVYFGGGSPSFLSQEQIRRLLGGLQDRMPWDGVVECTFECEPGTVSAQKLRALREQGVTRVSLGVQSLTPRVLALSGREASASDCLGSFLLARGVGFREINIDLLAGLPGETEESWMDTLEKVAGLEPDCITIYQLEVTHNSVLYALLRRGAGPSLASWSEKRRWVDRAFRALEKVGYTIGSGYMAIRNPESWRFVYTVENFWHGADLLALGETAFGHFQGVHYQNADTLDGYSSLVGEGRLPLRRVRGLSDEEKLRREVILQLKTGVLDSVYFQGKFGVDIREKFRRELESLERRYFLEARGDSICLTREGLLRVDSLLETFYLEEHRGIRYT